MRVFSRFNGCNKVENEKNAFALNNVNCAKLPKNDVLYYEMWTLTQKGLWNIL